MNNTSKWFVALIMIAGLAVVGCGDKKDKDKKDKDTKKSAQVDDNKNVAVNTDATDAAAGMVSVSLPNMHWS